MSTNLTAPNPNELVSPATPERTPVARTVLMCKPDFFTVVYRINP